MNSIPNIVKLDYLEEYNIKVLFDNQIEKIINYAPFIKNGVSSALADISFLDPEKLKMDIWFGQMVTIAVLSYYLNYNFFYTKLIQ